MLTSVGKWLWNNLWEYIKGLVLTELLTALQISLPPIIITAIIWI
jgi:hypothetical protein